MAKETFRGGIHPNEHKEYSRGEPLKIYETKGDVILPLSQNIGRPAKPVVKRNDPVLVGQVIGEADGFVSANIIASVSGKVKAVEKRRTLNGSLQECIVIENDFKEKYLDKTGKKYNITKYSKDEFIYLLKKCAITGLSGSGFPTYIKYENIKI